MGEQPSSGRAIALGRRALAIVVGAFALANVLKGLPRDAGAISWPYYLLTYGHGFIRRGLVGTVFRWITDGLDYESQKRLIVSVHCLVMFGFGLGLCAWSASVARGRSRELRTAVGVGVGALMLSRFSTNMMYEPGYLDIYLLVVTALAVYLVDRGRFWSAAIVGSIGPFIHDASIFLWLTVMLLAARRVRTSARWRADLLRAAPLLLPFVAEAIVLEMSSYGAIMRAIDEVPGAAFLKGTFDIGTGKALEIMTGKLIHQPDQVLLGVLLFLPPAVLIGWEAYRLDRDPLRVRRVMIIALAALAPTSVLLVAWDYSRFLMWAIFGAFLALLSIAQDQADDVPPASRTVASVRVASLLLLALLSTGPQVFLYFEEAFADYPFGPEILRDTPAAKLTYAFLAVYDRHELKKELVLADRCEGDGAAFERSKPCRIVLGPKSWFETGDWVAAGDYTLTLRTAPGCEGTIEIKHPWRFERPQPHRPIDAAEMRIDVPIDTESSVMAPLRIRFTSEAGCAIEDLRVVPTRR